MQKYKGWNRRSKTQGEGRVKKPLTINGQIERVNRNIKHETVKRSLQDVRNLARALHSECIEAYYFDRKLATLK